MKTLKEMLCEKAPIKPKKSPCKDVERWVEE